MPETKLVFYMDSWKVPVLEWLNDLRRTDVKAYAQCFVRIEQLAASGFELRRPAADILRDGIYELRAKKGRVQYRILYFFHGRNIAILAHAIVKQGDVVPNVDIDRAIRRKRDFVSDPDSHTFVEILENEEDQTDDETP